MVCGIDRPAADRDENPPRTETTMMDRDAFIDPCWLTVERDGHSLLDTKEMGDCVNLHTVGKPCVDITKIVDIFPRSNQFSVGEADI